MNFVNDRCLIKNQAERADTIELLGHPFVKNADDEEHIYEHVYMRSLLDNFKLETDRQLQFDRWKTIFNFYVAMMKQNS